MSGNYLIRAAARGKVFHYDGKKFSDHARIEFFATKNAAIRYARKLMRAYPILTKYKISVASQADTRKLNPSVREDWELDDAKRLFADFTGHKAKHILKKQYTPIKTGLAFGILDDIGYTTVRDGRLELYRHSFKKSSRPLLIASHDGKQLGIVGGRYQFTEAGIEDR